MGFIVPTPQLRGKGGSLIVSVSKVSIFCSKYIHETPLMTMNILKQETFLHIYCDSESETRECHKEHSYFLFSLKGFAYIPRFPI